MPSTVGRTRFERLGRLCYRRRRLVIVGWVVAVAALLPALSALPDRLTSGGFTVAGSESARVQHAVHEDFAGSPERTSVLVLSSARWAPDSQQFRAAVQRVRRTLTGLPGVAGASDPGRSGPDVSTRQRVALVVVAIDEPQDAAFAHAPLMQTAVDRSLRGTGVRGQLAGNAPFYAAFQATAASDLRSAERLALPASLLILVVVFGSLVAAAVPVLLAGLALAVAFGLVSLLAGGTEVNLITENLASMLGLGVGIDYSLFLLRRYRPALQRSGDVQDAVGAALASSGPAVFLSALTVVCALAGTSVVPIPAYRSMGYGAMIAVAVAGAAALTLLPALLGVVGHRIDRLGVGRLGAGRRGIRRLGAGRLGAVGGSGHWHRWALAVMRRPRRALAGALVVLALLAWPALDLRLGSSGPAILPAAAAPRAALDTMAAGFGAGRATPLQVLVRSPDRVLGAGRSDVSAVSDFLAAQDQVLRVESAAGAGSATSRDGRAALLTAVTRGGPQDPAVEALVRRLRVELPRLVTPGTAVAVGGEPGLGVDLNDAVSTSLPRVVGLVLVASFLLLLGFFRSPVLAVKAVVTNLLSVLAACGVLVLVAQQGHGAQLLLLSAPGYIEVFVPLFLFCILFGLSMDYEVFLLSAVREEYLRHGDNTEAVGRGLERTAGVITGAATIMVVLFGAFATTSLVPVQDIGFGLAVAVVLDATVVRLVLVPATLALLGDRNWWAPRWLRPRGAGARHRRRGAQRRFAGGSSPSAASAPNARTAAASVSAGRSPST